MQTTDLAIKYKNLHQAAELMIANIDGIGFDVSEYEKVLKEISDSVKDNVKVSYNKGFARANYEMDYSNGIMELNKLINHLEKYDVYFKVLNSCEWLDIRITDKNITNDELKQYVGEMAYNLKRIVNSDTMDYDNEKHVVEMVFETAYKIIKLELMMTGNSSLYDYINREDINISYFNIIIKEELATLKGKSNNDTFLREKLFQIRKNGINSNYFDLELIKILLIHDGNNSFKDKINNNMHEIVGKINSNIKEINKLNQSINEDKDTINVKYMDIKYSRKNIFIRAISTLAAASVMFGIGFGIPRLAKKIATGSKYLKTTEIYSTINDEIVTETDEVIIGYEPDNSTIVRVYDPYENNKRRDYQEYDVSYLGFDNAKDYYEYGIDNYEAAAQDGVLKIGNGDEISDYQNKYTEVIKKTYEYQGVGIDHFGYSAGTTFLFFLYLIILSGIEASFSVWHDYPIVIYNVKELIDNMKSLSNYKKGYKYHNDEIIKKVSKIMELINQNDELRNEFNRLYEANKYLLDDPDELLKKFNELDDNTVKKLIKETRHKR